MDQKVNDFSLFNDIDLKTEEYARKAFRARPQNLWVYLHGDKTAYEVDNISISGLCFKTKISLKRSLVPDQQIRLILASSKKEFLSIIAQVVRVEDDSCSCFFPHLTDEEETFLDKFILEMQKNEILRIKLERQKKIEEEKERNRLLKLQKQQMEKAKLLYGDKAVSSSDNLSFSSPEQIKNQK